MDRSSISSSRRAIGPPWGLLVAIGLLVLLEGSLRVLNAPGLLPSPEDRELAYRGVVPELQAAGAPDVAIVGSSRARRAVISQVLRSKLSDEGVEVRIGNFALAGAQAEEVELVIRRLLEDPSLPRLLIWPISPRELEGREQRPIATVRYLWRPGDWWVARRELGGKADQYLPDAIRNEAARHSWIVRYRFAMRDLVENPPRERVAAAIFDVISPSSRMPTTIQGGLHPKHLGRNRNRSIDVDRRRVERYVGTAYRHAAWPRNYQADHLEEAVRLTTRAGVPLVFVELPSHPMLEDVMPPGTTAKFRKHMRGVAERYGLRFVAIPDVETTFVREDFLEQSHVNYRGAEKFTKTIVPIVTDEL